MTDLAGRVSQWLADHSHEMPEVLKALVDIDSNSYDKAGVDAVGRAIEDLLRRDGIDVTRVTNGTYGDVLRATIPSGASNEHVLLLGHRDTVFKTGTVAVRPFTRDGDTAYGPGVADMKSGLVANIFILRALKALGPLSFPVVALFTADEEIGSPSGRAVIEAAAKGARAVFNTEPGRISGNVVTARKGGAGFRVTVTGRAAHSGVNHKAGASATEALARKISALHALTDYANEITTNIGIIRGGEAYNTVTAFAEAELDVRFVRLEQYEQLAEAIARIVAREDVSGTSATLTRFAYFPPLEEKYSQNLLRLYQAATEQLGFTVEGEFTGGCSDAGFTASIGVPTLCGLGPVGAHPHTEQEFCRLDTMLPRTQALALTICKLGAQA